MLICKDANCPACLVCILVCTYAACSVADGHIICADRGFMTEAFMQSDVHNSHPQRCTCHAC